MTRGKMAQWHDGGCFPQAVVRADCVPAQAAVGVRLSPVAEWQCALRGRPNLCKGKELGHATQTANHP
jgi:hypothetical protein